MALSVEQRQKLLFPFTLRAIQVAFDLIRRRPYITADQRNSMNPFFVIGSGRCGSTLLRSILINHPLVHIPPESAALPSCAKKFSRYGGADWQDVVSITLGEFAARKAFDYFHLDLHPVSRQLNELPKKDQSLAAIIDAIYQAHMQQHKPEATVWGDKTIHNILRLRWMDKMFPQGKYINLVRDGRDVVSSFMKSGLEPDLEIASQRWNWALDAAEKFGQKKGSSQFITVRYEDLVEDPVTWASKLYAFLDLPAHTFEDERDFQTMGDTVLNHHANVQNPINKNSIGKWKKNLTDAQTQRIEQISGDWLRRKGYVQ